ncbi:MAG: response regulator transcription factor, partial [Rhodanobacteraceae bacterium]|nr:response regulator transcription factor [Rhodanobacteraceae bacterium]
MAEPIARAIRIALVDDQALVLKGLSALLHGFNGIEVALEAGDGAQLLAALAQRPVDVIVSDIRMPGIGGIELIGRLREAGNATPVILLTTFDDSELML